MAWNRSNWLAEKVHSGELPAAESDVLRRCDRIFVEDDDVGEHVRNLVVELDRGGRADGRDAGVRAYLERLLLVREMWSRECH